MDISQRVIEVLEAAERALVALSAEAAAGREYGWAGRLMATAGQVAELGRPYAGGQGTVGGELAGGVAASAAAAVEPGPPARGTQAGRRAAGEYPRFHREGDDTLVKIGWSKSDRSTYEHRSPRAVLERLAGVIANVGGGGHRFTTDDVLARGADRLGEVPSYQVYLCLAFIVRRGLVERHGRQGYTIPEPGAFASAVNAAWAALPKR